ncbi:MAG: hypothetical protein Fur0032_24730 [Terrimicrobiaceae bacterium]
MHDAIAESSKRSGSNKVALSNDWAVLREILRPGLHLSIWRREPLLEAKSAVDALRRARDPLAMDSGETAKEEILQTLSSALPDASPELQSSVAALAEDFFRLADEFSEITGRRHLRIRAERVEDDGYHYHHDEY